MIQLSSNSFIRYLLYLILFTILLSVMGVDKVNNVV